MDAKRYIIVDDFVASGKTLITISQEMTNHYVKNGYQSPKCVGFALYNETKPLEEILESPYRRNIKFTFPDVKWRVSGTKGIANDVLSS